MEKSIIFDRYLDNERTSDLDFDFEAKAKLYLKAFAFSPGYLNFLWLDTHYAP